MGDCLFVTLVKFSCNGFRKNESSVVIDSTCVMFSNISFQYGSLQLFDNSTIKLNILQ